MSVLPISQATGYYHWPPVWVETPPDDVVGGASDEVFRVTLNTGIKAKVLRGGTFVLDFSKSPVGYIAPDKDYVHEIDEVHKVIFERTAVLNVHLACLYSAIGQVQHFHLAKMVITPADVIIYRTFDDKGAISHSSRVATQQHYMQCPSAIPQRFSKWRKNRAATIDLNAVSKSFELLEYILQHPENDALELVNLYARGCKAYEDHNFSMSLIMAWAIIEKLLNYLWERTIDQRNVGTTGTGNKKFINSERRKKLVKGQDYTASVKIEMLSLWGVITFPLYEELNKVRQARNSWIHELKPLSEEEVRLALRLTDDMLRLLYGIDLRVPLGRELMF